MSVIDPRCLALEQLAPGTVIAIYSRAAGGKTMLARAITANHLQQGGRAVILTSEPMLHNARHVEFADLDHIGVDGPERPGDPTLVVYDRSRELDDRDLEEIEIDRAAGRAVVITRARPMPGLRADINVITGRHTRHLFETVFDVPAGEERTDLGRGQALLAASGDEPVVITFQPGPGTRP